ncbi:MAG: uridine kinase, partial [Chloroflexota bacterium]|nr:uridine kinase [Chloroflexota bacterium]
LALSHPTRVAIDGVDAAGKTTLADELAGPLRARGRLVIRASIDGFHNPREVRHRRGPDSPEGYYLDSFDHGALCASLLQPLGPGGDLRYRTATFDYRTDSRVAAPERLAPADAVLLFDGVFLLRPDLDGFWDYVVFVDVPLEVTLERAQIRDTRLFGTAEAVRAQYMRRYVPGQRIYLERCRPKQRADAVVANVDASAPTLRVRTQEPDGG